MDWVVVGCWCVGVIGLRMRGRSTSGGVCWVWRPVLLVENYNLVIW